MVARVEGQGPVNQGAEGEGGRGEGVVGGDVRDPAHYATRETD